MLRGGAFKPRTSPYSFQGLGPKGLDISCAVKEEVRTSDRYRTDVSGISGCLRRESRSDPDRRKKYAELRSVKTARSG